MADVPEGLQRVGPSARRYSPAQSEPVRDEGSKSVEAYGDRWKKLGDWLKTIDPNRRMVNEFFAELLP